MYILGQRGFIVDPTPVSGVYDRADFDESTNTTFCDVVAVLPSGGVAYLGEITDTDGTFEATRADSNTIQTFDDRTDALTYLKG